MDKPSPIAHATVANSRQNDTRLALIDVLRALAICLVLVHHLPTDLGVVFGSIHDVGGRGVDLFFVLSGFLIGTTSLERVGNFPHAGGLAHARSYWILRSARVFPLYFGLLALFASGLAVFHRDVVFVIRNYPVPYLTFTSNYLGQGTLELGVLWSLAIEEQFYLIVGILIMLAGSSRERLASSFATLSIVALAVATLARYDLLDLREGGALAERMYVFRLFHGTLARMDQLGLGLLTALLAGRFNSWISTRSGRASRLTSWAAIGLCVGVTLYVPHRPVIGFFVLGVLYSGTIMWVQRPAARAIVFGPFERAALWPLRHLGRLSFGLYLLHPIARYWVSGWLSEGRFPMNGTVRAYVFLIVWVAVSTAMAQISYRIIEEPILRAARKRAHQLLKAHVRTQD